LTKSPLIYRVLHFNVEGLSPTMSPRDDGSSLNFPYAVIIEIRIRNKKLQSSNQVRLNRLNS